jgi:hypothetical protein
LLEKVALTALSVVGAMSGGKMRKLILSSAALIGAVAAPAQAQSVGSIINTILGVGAYGYQPRYSYPSYGYAPSYGYQPVYGYQPSYGYAQPYGYGAPYSAYGYGIPGYGANGAYYACKPRRHHRNGMVYYTPGC